MTSNFGIYNIEGENQVVASSSYEITADPTSANYNERRLVQRDLRDDTEVAVGLEAGNNLQWHDVIPDISSSRHEAKFLNTFYSGTTPLETTQVPASASMFYSKQSRFVKKTYYLTASLNLPNNSLSTPSSVEFSGTRYNSLSDLFDPLSGSYSNNHMWEPAVYEIEVPDYGKIRDIKVWVELIHDHRTGPGIVPANVNGWGGAGDPNPNLKQGLQGLQIALRSPNTNFQYAHPLWNEKTLLYKKKDIDPFLAVESPPYIEVPKLLTNSYLLWAGHAVERDLGTTLGGATASLPDEFYESQILAEGQSFLTGSVIGVGLSDNILSSDIDKENRPHLSFRRQDALTDDFDLYYATLKINGWNYYKIVDLFSEVSTDFTKHVLRVDKNNKPAVCFVTTGSVVTTDIYKYYYSEDEGVTWLSESFTGSLNSVGLAAAYFSFKFDKNNVATLLTTDKDGAFLHRRVSASNWVKEKIISGYFPFDPTENYQNNIGLDFDSNNNVAVVIPSLIEGILYCFRSSSSGWTTEKIEDKQRFVSYADCVFDSNDKLHVSCISSLQENGNDIYYYSDASGSWSSTLVNGPENLIFTGSIYPVYNFPVPFSTPRISLNKKLNKPNILWTVQKGDAIYGVVELCQIKIAQLTERGFSIRNVFSKEQNAGLACKSICTDYLGNDHIFFVTSSIDSPVVDSYSKIVYTQSSGSLFEAYTGTKSRVRRLEKSSSLYHSFNTDADMRTIFSDSSEFCNPRHNLSARESMIDKIISRNAYPSPSSSSLTYKFKKLSYDHFNVVYDTDNFLTGANVPWFIDERIIPGFFYGKDYSYVTASDGTTSVTPTLPPPGWFRNGSSAGVNEWPTAGMSLGPNDIKPVYPLLDDVFVEKVWDQPSLTNIQAFPRRYNKLVGFRPGLRGTEVHGKWTLMIACNVTESFGPYSISVSQRDGFWFRQLRLEFLLDQGEESKWSSYSSKNSRFKKSGNVSSKPGIKLFEIVSGSASWDIGTNYVYTVQPEDYGRSYGISQEDAESEFAVKSIITGSFRDILSGSGKLDEVESTFLNNEFGTPYIPISSGSSEIPSYDPFTTEEAAASRNLFQTVMNPNAIINSDSTLPALIARSNIIKSRRDLVIEQLRSGSL